MIAHRPPRPATIRALALLAGACLWILPTSQASLAAETSSLQKELNSVANEYTRIQSRLDRTNTQQQRLEEERLKNEQTIARRSEALKKRAGSIYRRGAGGIWTDLLTSPDLGVFVRRLYFLERLGDQDTRLVEQLRIAQGRAEELRTDLASARTLEAALARQLKARQVRLEARLKEATKAEESRKREAAAKLRASRTASGSQRRALEAAAKGVRLTGGGKFGSFALPIAGPAGFADTWGAARDGGRRHQGTDVMAPCGAPVVAVTSGTITRTMSGGAGGIMAYLRANNGDVFFYAHLLGFSDGTAAGRRVSTGDLIARNGNTGNARGGPCHVHFEWHPGGGRPVNPYSLLASAR